MEKILVRKAVPLHGQSMEQISCSLQRTPHQSKWISREGCDPVESLHWRGLPAGPVDLQREEPMLEEVYWQDWRDPHRSSLFLKECIPWKGPMLEQVCEEHQPMGRTHFGEISEELSFQWGRDPTLKQKNVRSPPDEEERVTETMCDELTLLPTPKFLCC